jgi:hypothetical protein
MYNRDIVWFQIRSSAASRTAFRYYEFTKGIVPSAPRVIITVTNAEISNSALLLPDGGFFNIVLVMGPSVTGLNSTTRSEICILSCVCHNKNRFFRTTSTFHRARRIGDGADALNELARH